jgi:Kef-type K+ transport system membrane component KefB
MHTTPESLFLIQSLIFIGLPFILWRIGFIRKIVPLVVVQIMLGILLGPSVFGGLYPEIFASFYNSDSLKALNGIAWLGLSLFGFLAGLHVDLKAVAKKGHGFILTSFSSLALPMALGALVAGMFVNSSARPQGIEPWAFVLGVATAIGVTALPVLSAILIELKIIDKPLGRRVLGYAVINDIMLWVLVALITGYASAADKSDHGIGPILITAGLAAVFLLFMLTIVRRFTHYLAMTGKLTDEPSSKRLAAVVVAILVSGLVTELIGVHFLLGAFLLGAVMPKSISHGLYHSFEKFTMLVLMPYFFILTGLKTSFSLDGHVTWLFFGAATTAAVLGKVIGTTLPELLINKSTPSIALKAGTLMQTKGLMEVVILNILLQAGIINVTVFSALVLMAVVTTFLTKPLLLLIDVLLKDPKPA